MTETTHFAVGHGGNAGDLLWAIPSIYSLLDKRGLKACVLYLKADQPARYHPQTIHPCGRLKMTRAFCESLIPLLKTQACFEDVKVWNGEALDIDLDLFRASGFYHDRGDIALYYSHVWPCEPKLWQRWLQIEAEKTDLILVNRTERYHNPKISYKFLEKPNVQFVGLADEFKAFRKEQRCNIPHLKTKTFLDMAQKIASCRLYIGNQSAGFAIADGLKVPRLLEIYQQAPNVFPHGPNGAAFWTQDIFEAQVKEVVG